MYRSYSVYKKRNILSTCVMMWIKGYNLGSWSSDDSEMQALLGRCFYKTSIREKEASEFKVSLVPRFHAKEGRYSV